MKNIKLKIIISAIVLAMILLISNNIQATIQIPGYNTTYYTKHDISWTGNRISWNGDHWCINHNYNLTGGLTKLTAWETSVTGDHSALNREAYAISSEGQAALQQWIAGWGYENGKLMQQMNDSLANANTVAYIASTTPGVASSAKEAAIYAFSSQCGDYATKIAIWNLMYTQGKSAYRRV